MSNPVAIHAVAVPPATPATVATLARPSIAATDANADDLALGDVAYDVLCTVIDMLSGDGDLAARTMLLAVAWLTHDDPTFGKATAVSTMLIEATREALDAFHNPSPAAPGSAGAAQ